MTLWVYSGRPSEGAYLLSKQPGFKRMTKGAGFVKGDTIIAWGNVKAPVHAPIILNGKGTHNAVDKRMCFQILAGQTVQTVPWTANQAVAKEWLAEGSTVVARKTLTGHEGSGIVIIEKGGQLIDAPLYTKYIFKTAEYRVHATSTEAFATHRKVRDPARTPTDWKVRSWKNGFIFQRNNIKPNAVRDALAVSAVAALGLDFGAVDIVEDKHGNFYVLEVNTAPGIEGTTVPVYAQALTALAAARHNHVGGGAPAVQLGGTPPKPATDHHVNGAGQDHAPQKGAGGHGKVDTTPAAAPKQVVGADPIGAAIKHLVGVGKQPGESDVHYIHRLFGIADAA